MRESKLGKVRDKTRERWSTTVGPVEGDTGRMIVASLLAVKWMFRCGNESGCGGASNGVILGCGVESSCGCCSGCDSCCGCESVSARNWGCAGHPLLRGCKPFPPEEHTIGTISHGEISIHGYQKLIHFDLDLRTLSQFTVVLSVHGPLTFKRSIPWILLVHVAPSWVSDINLTLKFPNP